MDEKYFLGVTNGRESLMYIVHKEVHIIHIGTV